MNSVLFLILRRMRAPLLVLSVVYAVATLGLTVIPGVDDQGNPWQMGFFHAFYFVTFMGTTIGFGELPYPFTEAQRMWSMVFIYCTVATWIYAIGTLISLLQNETLQRARATYQFERQVRRIAQPFCLICGYGNTGSQLVGTLGARLLGATVIEVVPERLDMLTLAENPLFVPGLCGDASDPDNLVLAGLNHPLCRSVVVLTNDDAANLHIAITAKILRPDIQVISRAESHEVEANMDSFGTDIIIDPFDTFAERLSLALHSPWQFVLADWLSADSGEPFADVMKVPDGLWILCGFGRFGRAVHAKLAQRGMRVQVIEPESGLDGLPKGTIIGFGTEAVTLEEAGVHQAVGIIAGANDDSNNLSIIVTARALNPGLFAIARKTERYNGRLFDALAADVVMASSEVVTRRIRSLLTNPLIDDFLSIAHANDDAWARDLVERLRTIAPGRIPGVWAVRIGEDEAAAVCGRIEAGEAITLGALLEGVGSDARLPTIALLHEDHSGAFVLPAGDTVLAIGDRLLFAGTRQGQVRLGWRLENEAALSYALTGVHVPQTSVGRWLNARSRTGLPV